MAIPFVIPTVFKEQVYSGKMVRHGAILKDAASGQIVAHLQETGSLVETLMNGSIKPFDPVTSVSSLASNWQLYRQDVKIDQMMDLMLSLGDGLVANTALTGLGLGINVAGFAMIKSKLEDISIKLDKLAEIVLREFGEIRVRELTKLEADLTAQLDQAEEGWQSPDGGTRIWTRVSDKLNDMVYYYPNLIEKNLRADPPELELLTYFLERYRSLAATRIECLVLIGEMDIALDFARRFSRKTNSLLDDVSAIDLARRSVLASGKELGSAERHLEVRKSLPKMQSFVHTLREFQDLFQTKPFLIETLIEENIDGREYVSTFKDTHMPEVVLLRFQRRSR